MIGIRKIRMVSRIRRHFRRTRYPLLDAALAVLLVVAGVEIIATITILFD